MRCTWKAKSRTSCLSGIGIVVYLFGLLFIHSNVKPQLETHSTPRDEYQNNPIVLRQMSAANVSRKNHIVIRHITVTDGRIRNSNISSKFKKRKRARVAKSYVVNLLKEDYDMLVTSTCHNESKEHHHGGNLCSCLLRLDDSVQLNSSLSTNYIPDDRDATFMGLDPGGHWKPTHCASRRRIAILIPYRDREEHLMPFMIHTHPILQKQLVEYQIFIIEQRYPYTFNKGSVMNAGYHVLFRNTAFRPDCLVFHDVDMLMLTENNMIMCFNYPTHVGAYIDKFNFSLLYDRMFGGVVALTPTQFHAVNGFSNMFRGWGGEDDDFYGRTVRKLKRIYRGPRAVSRYSMIKHDHDAANPINLISQGILEEKKAARKALKTYKKHGLNTVRYTLVDVRYLHLYTHIVLDLLDTANNQTKTGTFIRHNSTLCVQGVYRERVISMVTCEATCFKNTTGCAAFQYIHPAKRHSLCQLLTSTCAGPVSSNNGDLYVKQG